MSVNNTPPVSLKEIQYNFGKTGRVGSDDRYVRDFAQRDGDDWDLLDYMGQAYGLQFEIYKDWGTALDRRPDLPLEETERTADGDYHSLGNETNIVQEYDETRGKFYRVTLSQRGRQDNPAACGPTGHFYASEDGKYRVKAQMETTSDWPSDAEAWLGVYGYRYGYLSGERIPYLEYGYRVNPDPNTVLDIDEVIDVDPNYRHVVLHYAIWLSGGSGQSERAEMLVNKCTVERESP